MISMRPPEDQVSEFMAFVNAAQFPGPSDQWEALCRRAAAASAAGAALFHNFVLHDHPDLEVAESYVARSEIMAAIYADLYV